MLINYGSIMYFSYIFSAIILCAILYLMIKNQSEGVKKTVIFLVALINFTQHICKGKIYPQYQENYSIHLSTAYNVCAFLILISPFIILFGNELLKNYITYVGSFAGMVAMVVPYWFIGKSAFTWEVYRFYICHGLLFVSSMLPGLVRLQKLQWKHCWKIGLLFFAMLALILINDAVLIKVGLYPVANPDDLFASLVGLNPCWSMHPPTEFAFIGDLLAKITPSFLMGNNPWGIYLPILWYAIPMYLVITAGVCAFYALIEAFKKFREYLINSKVSY